MSGPATSEVRRGVLESALLGLLILVGALAFTIPIVWIYTVIMRQHGYDRHVDDIAHNGRSIVVVEYLLRIKKTNGSGCCRTSVVARTV